MGADVWDALIHHWAGLEFKKSSSQRKIARTYSKMSHTGGSKPFEAHKKDLEKELNKPPAHIDLFKRTHKKKSKQGIAAEGEWVSNSAKDVFSKYKEPVFSLDPSSASDYTLSQQQRAKVELDAYLAATGGVHKNRIVGIPRVPAYILVPTRYSQAHAHAQTHKASTSGPSPHVDGDVMQSMIHGVMKTLHTQLLQNMSKSEINGAVQETIHGSTNPNNSVPMDIELAVHRSLASLLEGALNSGKVQGANETADSDNNTNVNAERDREREENDGGEDGTLDLGNA